MRVETKRVGRNCLVVRCQGEFDLASASVFRQAVEDQLNAWEGLSEIVLNLGEVSFVDSSGLGAILGRYRHLQQRGGRMTLTDIPDGLRRVLELSGLYKIMPVAASEAEALQRA